MGSKRKIKTIFDALREDGVNEKLFAKVHTPIGLEIEAESPEEIAVSIAAEVIKVKNEKVIAHR
jgi:xanthine dehydrogenase accessory factor